MAISTATEDYLIENLLIDLRAVHPHLAAVLLHMLSVEFDCLTLADADGL